MVGKNGHKSFFVGTRNLTAYLATSDIQYLISQGYKAPMNNLPLSFSSDSILHVDDLEPENLPRNSKLSFTYVFTYVHIYSKHIHI